MLDRSEPRVLGWEFGWLTRALCGFWDFPRGHELVSWCMREEAAFSDIRI